MITSTKLTVNDTTYHIEVDPETPLLYVLRNDLGLKSVKYGCGNEQCGACKVLVDGKDVPSCKLPVRHVAGLAIKTLEGLGNQDRLHPLQEAILEEQAAQCGYCTSGMIIAAQGLLNRTRYPSDSDIREALNDNLCRCGVYDRIRRAVKLRIGRPPAEKAYNLQNSDDDGEITTTQAFPRTLERFPSLDSWISINEKDTVTVFSGKAELGQGIKTALAQIAAEELDLSLEQIRIVTADTEASPDEGITAGSMSIENSGNAIRYAAATARHILLTIAYEELESRSISILRVENGYITDNETGKQTNYWKLMGGRKFNQIINSTIQPKAHNTYHIVGQPHKRIDLLAKVTGQPAYVHDLEWPEMLHGRVIRPPTYEARLLDLDEQPIRNMQGVVKIVRNGSFIGVLAEREEQAIQAAQAIQEAATWTKAPLQTGQSHLFEKLQIDAKESAYIVDGTVVDDPIPEITTPPQSSPTRSSTFLRPYHMHASLGPSAAAAFWDGKHLKIWSHTQGVFNLRHSIAPVLNLEPEQIHITHVEGAGCYGHNGADDVGLDAALLAQAVPGRHILLKWMRADEHRWEPYGSAMIIKTRASLDNTGQIIDWNYDIWSYAHSTRPHHRDNSSGLIAAWHLDPPHQQYIPGIGRGTEFGEHRNAEPQYEFPHKRIVKHFAQNSPLRVSALRSLGAYTNIFAIESFMDELAFAAGIDPIEFRLRHLQNTRARSVIEAVASKANWTPRTTPSMTGNGTGIAFAQYKNRQCYAAIVVTVQVDLTTGDIQLKQGHIAADAGQVVNPDGLSNQLEGGFLQAASWTLYEAVQFDQSGITSLDWDTYPIMRFTRAPEIDITILNRTGYPFMGSGEATQGPAPAAIANAIYDATGVRLYEIPFTSDRMLAALKQ